MRERPSDSDAGGYGATGVLLIVLAVGAGIGGFLAPYAFPTSEWAYRWRYVMAMDFADNADYVIAPRPHDCEFMTAPLGLKHCTYEKQVVVRRVGPDAQRRPRRWTIDDGRTWVESDVDVRPGISVAWQKVQD